MGGVVVKGHIAAVFDNTGMEYFSTCGEPLWSAVCPKQCPLTLVSVPWVLI